MRSAGSDREAAARRETGLPSTMMRWHERHVAAPAEGNSAARFGVQWWVTDRGLESGIGDSVSPFDAANLAGHVGDRESDVAANRAAMAAEAGLDPDALRFMSQVHGAKVVRVGADASTPDAPSPEADAMVTTDPDVALVVLVADCVPILLVDQHRGAAAVVHAGRPGVLAGVVDASLDALADLGCDPHQIRAVVGPSVCPRCYEVPAEMREEFAEQHPVGSAVSWTGTPAIDVAAAAVARLRRRIDQVTWLPGCTREDPRLFSYRRDGRTGRFAGAVRLIDPGEHSPPTEQPRSPR